MEILPIMEFGMYIYSQLLKIMVFLNETELKNLAIASCGVG
jgi:hypothetical protein